MGHRPIRQRRAAHRDFDQTSTKIRTKARTKTKTKAGEFYPAALAL
ncbi:MAG: hypothetical protein OJF62_000220 [Pseudolabrys sp.]|nr:hypothetical protein [Pseudolabrys sp.]